MILKIKVFLARLWQGCGDSGMERDVRRRQER
jgi:hypothetical protein